MTERTDQLKPALNYAYQAHDGQVRKGSPKPYINHPIQVGLLVAGHGGNTDEMIAAVLHDVPEDGPLGEGHFPEILDLFGERVYELVRLCTETTVRPKPPWRDRKAEYVDRVRSHASEEHPDVGYLRVTLADKIDNVESMLADLDNGIDIYEIFNAPRPAVNDYYRALGRAFQSYTGDDPGLRRLIDRFTDLVAKLTP